MSRGLGDVYKRQVVSVVTSLLLFLILSPPSFFTVNLAKVCLFYLFFNKPTLVSLIFSIVFLIPTSFIFALIRTVCSNFCYRTHLVVDFINVFLSIGKT